LYDALGAPSDDLGPRKISTKLASYKLVNENTEEVTAPLSLAFTDQGSQFVAGTRNTISIFDINHPGEPITFIRTIPDGYKGVVTSLGVSPASTVSRSGILAAGTRNRQIGLYESEGYGQLITRFNLPGSLEGANPGPRAVTKPAAWLRDPMEERMGNGVTQLKWSACGNYLYIAEGMSDTILIYDIRNYTMAVGFCVGRNAMTTQKLGFDHFHGHEGQEVWAGDMEGNVRLWRNPHQFGGPINADHEYGRAVEAEVTTEVGFDPVVSTLVLYGNYLVTAQGVVNGTEDRGCVSIHGFDLVG
jgi:WD40 repeat protein